jgi:hypothetical protein
MTSQISQSIIDKVFSHEVFRGLDRASLMKKYDVTSSLREINAPLRVRRGQAQQIGPVIASIPPEGIIITNPGTYTFAGDITWNAPSAGGFAIGIVADNVVLDLSSFTLMAIVPDNSQTIAGIVVDGASSVTIRNGTLANMCLYGICAEVCNNLTIEKVNVAGMSFNNLSCRNTTPAGIHINVASNVSVTECSVQDMQVTADGSAGIQMTLTTGAVVSSCQMSNLVNNDGSVQGYSYIGSQNIRTTDCKSSQFQSHFNGNILASGHTVLGFLPFLCTESTFENCSATGMTGCCDDCHGMSVFLCSSVSVTGFTANAVVDGVAQSNTGAKATGLEVYGTSISINNCSVNDIKAINPQDLQSTGFSAWGADITFTGCTASNVVVCDQNGNWNPDLGYGTGFGWAPDPRPPFCQVGATNVQYSGCGAASCNVGFDTWFHIDSTWTDPSYTNCGIDILVQPGGTRTLTGNPCSECNPPITTPLTNIAEGNTYPPT